MDQAEIEAKLAALEELGKANSLALAKNAEAARAASMTKYWQFIEGLPSKHSAAGYGMVIGIGAFVLTETLAYFIGHAF